MIPNKTIEELISRHSTLEKDLSSGTIDKKLFAEKSKEYSDVNEIIENAKKYLSYEDDKKDLEKILNDMDEFDNVSIGVASFTPLAYSRYIINNKIKYLKKNIDFVSLIKLIWL